MQQQIPWSNFESSAQREKVNLNVGTATKQLEAWRSWESSDRTGCDLQKNSCSSCEAISDGLKNPPRN